MLNRFLTTKEQLVLLGVGLAFGIGGVATYFAQSDDTREPIIIHAVPDLVQTQQETTRNADPPFETIQSPILSAPEPVPASSAALPEDTPRPRVAISVAGAVSRPGLYQFDSGSRVNDAIKAAGGVLDNADTSSINLAAALIDGTTLTIPFSGHERRTDGNRLVLRSNPAVIPNPPQYTISGWQYRPASSPAAGTAAAPQSSPVLPTTEGRIDLNTASAEQLETLPGIGPKLADEIVRYRNSTRFQTVDDLLNVHGIGPKRLDAVRSLVTAGGS
jgi:competence protein ComEA